MNKQNHYVLNICSILAFSATVIWLILSPSSLLNHTIRVSLLPFFSSVLILYKNRNFNIHKVPKIAALFLTVLFLTLLSINEIIKCQIFSSKIWLVIYIFLLAWASYISIGFSLKHFIKKRTLLQGADEVKPYVLLGHIRIYRLLLPLSIAAFCFLMANYPFRPSPDAVKVYTDILSKNWNDWHPIGYVTFVRTCMFLVSAISPHPFATCFVQSVLWLALCNYSLDSLYRHTNSKKALQVYTGINLVIFIPLMYLGLMYKDVVYSMCVLGLCIGIFNLIHLKDVSWKEYLRLSIFAIGMCIFRHMGIVAALCPLFFLFVFFLIRRNIRWKGLLVPISAAVVMFFLVTDVYGNAVLNMKENPPFIKYTIPLYISGSMASSTPEAFTEEDRALLEEIMPFEDWITGYNLDPYWADTLSRFIPPMGEHIHKVDDAYGSKIVKLNLRLLLREPTIYVKSILRITSMVWQIACPEGGYEWTVAGYYAPADRPDFVKDHLVTTEKPLTEALSTLQYFVTDLSIPRAVYYRGGIWLFVFVFLAVVFWIRKEKRSLLAFTAPVIITAMLMISCPSQDPRFVLPMVEVCIFFLPLSYFSRIGYAKKLKQ